MNGYGVLDPLHDQTLTQFYTSLCKLHVESPARFLKKVNILFLNEERFVFLDKIYFLQNSVFVNSKESSTDISFRILRLLLLVEMTIDHNIYFAEALI